MYKGNFEVEVLVNGHPVKEYWKNNRLYIQGNKGTRYTIRIRNNSGRRILAIPTVDGVSAISGNYGGYESPGYIIRPNSSYEIRGWRKSDKDVAEFFFTDGYDSYAAQTGKGGNQGVIGVAVFYEKEYYSEYQKYWKWWDPYKTTTFPQPTWRWDTISSYVAGDIKPCASSKQDHAYYGTLFENPKNELGTGWGDTVRSEVTNVEFQKESSPTEVFEIYYNTREELEKLGIDFNSRPAYVSPQAFPQQYCEPPRNRR